MQDFSWNVFAATGNIESYLLYKEHERLISGKEEREGEEEQKEET
ncbi:MAG: YqzL family protein [Thermicanus sp.]|nr:YqzL family protein [Thermicanus sp.]